MTGRWMGWMTAAVVAVGIMSLTPVFGADARSGPARGDVSRSGEGVQQDSRRVAAKPLGSSAYDLWQAGNTDANISPETLRRLALQYGLSTGEFAQAVPADEQEYDAELTEYDPWEPFNRVMFEFNRRVDRFVLKPAATAWNF